MRASAPPALPATDPGARRALRLLRRSGPVGRGVAVADIAAYRALRGVARTPSTVARVRAFSRTGEHAACWLILGTVGATVDTGRRDAWLRATRGVAAAYLANTALKQVFRRRRPLFDGLPALIGTPTALSFPSAHASSSFAAAQAFAPLVGPAATPLRLTAGAMALSRVYLGVHYPTDILAGALLGTAVGTLFQEGRS
ncbi:MAG: phosphoesterase PA-phosphatase related protein [Solirubrobacterales bacterium]|nr:phosphoesterase PA-phosphatase related protein [Solirubrobacterales bacterium]